MSWGNFTIKKVTKKPYPNRSPRGYHSPNLGIRETIIAMWKEGKTPYEMADEHGISVPRVHGYMRREGLRSSRRFT